MFLFVARHGGSQCPDWFVLVSERERAREIKEGAWRGCSVRLQVQMEATPRFYGLLNSIFFILVN